ncbi:hypothetical protein DFH07DRAFT_962563 [Mycena maculata]|uniref:Peptidase C14 caspase domain-containing protein n=1 Tax=Mycena maculata TaxID=230809 RepID=A0AAD7IQJ7_9AGAR|nr:hypothetical protein DFH07DRAFT_962563 [Mycena maculata]
MEGPSPLKGSNVFALVIGINTYSSSDYPNLQGAVNDARAFEKYLLEPPKEGGGGGLGVPDSNILVLEDLQATRAGILEAFQSHFLNNTKIPDGGDAAMILFYAGHGETPADPLDAHRWAHYVGLPLAAGAHCSDAHAGGRNTYLIRKVIVGEACARRLLRQLARKKGPNVTVIFDSCHSGGLGRDSGQERTGNGDSSEVPLELDSHLWEGEAGAAQTVQSIRMWSPGAASHVLLAACGQDETAREIKHDGDDT